jgi:hypothetical protein
MSWLEVKDRDRSAALSARWQYTAHEDLQPSTARAFASDGGEAEFLRDKRLFPLRSPTVAQSSCQRDYRTAEGQFRGAGDYEGGV